MGYLEMVKPIISINTGAFNTELLQRCKDALAVLTTVETKYVKDARMDVCSGNVRTWIECKVGTHHIEFEVVITNNGETVEQVAQTLELLMEVTINNLRAELVGVMNALCHKLIITGALR